MEQTMTTPLPGPWPGEVPLPLGWEAATAAPPAPAQRGSAADPSARMRRDAEQTDPREPLPDVAYAAEENWENPSAPLRTAPPAVTAPMNTDYGNAERLVAAHGDVLRYHVQRGCWLAWDGRRWAVDSTGEAMRRAKDTIRGGYPEAVDLPDAERRLLVEHLMNSEAVARLNAMLTLARTEPGIPVTASQLDADPWLLNVANGTVDLRTGEQRPHAPGDLLTKLAPVSYRPEATAPLWEAFLDKVTGGDQQLVAYLARLVGYAMTGLTHEHVLPVLHGDGANGKPTFIEVLLALFGDYGKVAAPGLLLAKTGSEHPTGLADLAGARLVTAVEVNEGRRFDEALVKQLTGGDRIKARYMRQDFFEFDPTFTVFLVANHRPVVRGSDHGIWRRLALVPFTVTIAEHERIPDLKERLATELPGILAWAVRGCLDWQARGRLDPPAAVRDATAAYQVEQDSTGRFLTAATIAAPTGQVPAADLYAAYTAWCADQGETPLSQKALASQLRQRGHTNPTVGRAKRTVWCGLTLPPS
jgi:putative DNA primase/helicase